MRLIAVFALSVPTCRVGGMPSNATGHGFMFKVALASMVLALLGLYPSSAAELSQELA